MSSNYCVMCGAEIPEGTIVCKQCVRSVESKSIVKSDTKIPVDRKSEYTQGYTDGYKQANREWKESLEKWMKQMLGKLKM
jgi:predicted amidophosphoribosyltransferase